MGFFMHSFSIELIPAFIEVDGGKEITLQAPYWLLEAIGTNYGWVGGSLNEFLDSELTWRIVTKLIHIRHADHWDVSSRDLWNYIYIYIYCRIIRLWKSSNSYHTPGTSRRFAIIIRYLVKTVCLGAKPSWVSSLIRMEVLMLWFKLKLYTTHYRRYIMNFMYNLSMNGI